MNKLIKNPYSKKTILIFTLLLISLIFFPQQNGKSQDNLNENPKELTIKYVSGKIFIRNIGEENKIEGAVEQVLGIKYEIILNEDSACIVEFENRNITISGPITLRVKDILSINEKMPIVHLNNIFVNKLASIFTDTNKNIVKILKPRKNFKNNDSNYKEIVEITEESYFERGFSIAVELIQSERTMIDKSKTDPELYKFYYLLAEIAFQTLNFNIAESSIHITLKETEPDENKTLNKEQQPKIEIRQNTYLLASIIHTLKSEYNIAIEYLENAIKEFSESSYFKERTGYLCYYMLGINYMAKDDGFIGNIVKIPSRKAMVLENTTVTIEEIEENPIIIINDKTKKYFNTAYQLCNSSIDSNIRTLKALLKQKRTLLIDEKIKKYFCLLNEASLMLGYIKDINRLIKFL